MHVDYFLGVGVRLGLTVLCGFMFHAFTNKSSEKWRQSATIYEVSVMYICDKPFKQIPP